MSRKASAVSGDPTDDTGSPVLGQDDQGREEMSASLNSGAGPEAGVQSTSTQPTPVSGQEGGSGKRGRSAHLHKQMETYSRNTHQQKLTPKTRKTKTRTAKGVKAFGTEGTKSGLVPGAGRGRGLASLLPTTKPKPRSVPLLASSEEEEEDEASAHLPPHSAQESQPDQFALSPVIAPQGTSTPGDVTTSVTDTPVLPQDPSSVSNDALPSSSASIKQEETADNVVTVSVDVHGVPNSEQDEGDVSEDPLAALAHATLGTQTGSELSRQEDPFHLSSAEEMENEGRTLILDPAKPVAELVGQMRAHLSPTWGYAPSGERVPPFDSDDLDMLEGYVEQVGWTELPLLQPKQVPRAGVACLVRALRGTVIQLVQSEDNDSDTSHVTTLDSSQPLDRSE